MNEEMLADYFHVFGSARPESPARVPVAADRQAHAGEKRGETLVSGMAANRNASMSSRLSAGEPGDRPPPSAGDGDGL